MKIGDKIKTLRVKNDYTQTELASKLGIAQNTLSDYERNRVAASIEIIEKLSSIFDVSRDYFLDNVNKPVKQEPAAEPKSSMTYNLLKRLVEEGIIDDPNDIDDDDTIRMIMNAAKVDLALIKNKK